VIWTITEQAATPLDGFDAAWLPESAFEYLKVSIRGGRVTIDSGPYSGAIYLLNGETLHIAPRAGAKAFGRMLLVSEGLADALEKSGGLASFALTNESGRWGPALARSFVRHLHNIEAESLRPARLRTKTRGEVAAGRIHALKTVVALHRREPKPVHFSLSMRTVDTPEHRVLGRAARTIAGESALDLTERNTALAWASRFGGSFLPSDLEEVVGRVRRGQYFGPRSYYQSALLTANVLLGVGGMGLANRPDLAAECLVTNTSTIFEKYIRHLLSSSLSPWGYVVRKGTEPPPSLFTDGSISMTPDVVISNSQGIRAIVDAKYKPSPGLDAGDCYQMYSYLSRMGVSRGVLVSAARTDRKPSSTLLRTPDGRSLYDVRMPLDGEPTTEAWLLSHIHGLL
jgi:hypothetical protein